MGFETHTGLRVQVLGCPYCDPSHHTYLSCRPSSHRMSEPHRRDESGAASTWRGAGIQGTPEVFSSCQIKLTHPSPIHQPSNFGSFSKNTSSGYFSCPAAPRPHPMPNIENAPTWPCFRCSAAFSPCPSCWTRKTCP